MKVLQLITPTGFYGAERWVLALANELEAVGVECDLAVTSEDSADRYELLERFPTSNGQAHRIEMSGRFDIRVVGRLCEIISSRQVDLVHSHGYKSDLIGLLAARRSGVRCMSTPHGFGQGLDWKMRLFVALGVRSLRRFDRVAPLSDALMRELEQRGLPPSRLVLIENAVDLAEIDAVASTSSSVANSDSLLIGYVGRLVTGKRVDHLIRAFDGLWHADASRRLVIIGDGPERQALESQAGALPSARAISFEGFLEHRFDPMRAFSLFVLPSASEGIPRCAMEALALRLPVVGYDIPGLRELSGDGESALLVPSGNVEALEAACEKLLSDADRRRRMGQAGRRLVETRFSASRMATDYAALYREVVGSPPRSGAGRP